MWEGPGCGWPAAKDGGDIEDRGWGWNWIGESEGPIGCAKCGGPENPVSRGWPNEELDDIEPAGRPWAGTSGPSIDDPDGAAPEGTVDAPDDGPEEATGAEPDEPVGKGPTMVEPAAPEEDMSPKSSSERSAEAESSAGRLSLDSTVLVSLSIEVDDVIAISVTGAATALRDAAAPAEASVLEEGSSLMALVETGKEVTPVEKAMATARVLNCIMMKKKEATIEGRSGQTVD